MLTFVSNVTAMAPRIACRLIGIRKLEFTDHNKVRFAAPFASLRVDDVKTDVSEIHSVFMELGEALFEFPDFWFEIAHFLFFSSG